MVADLACVSRAERIKEEIGWLKLLFGITVAVEVSLLAWLAQNYGTADAILVIGGSVAAALVATFGVLIYLRVLRRLEDLEKE